MATARLVPTAQRSQTEYPTRCSETVLAATKADRRPRKEPVATKQAKGPALHAIQAFAYKYEFQTPTSSSAWQGRPRYRSEPHVRISTISPVL